MRTRLMPLLAITAGFMLTTGLQAADIYGLNPGNPELKSAGPLAFGPSGILFIADPMGAAIFAVQTSDEKAAGSAAELEIASLQKQLASKLNLDAGQVRVTDLAVNPETQNIFLSVTAENQSPRIVKVTPAGEISEVSLEGIAFSKAELPNAIDDQPSDGGRRRRYGRESSITDLAFVNGQLVVAGLNNQEDFSNVWSLMFPFQKVDRGTNIEIFHGNHGRSETTAPIQTFVPFIVNGEPNIVAGFVCTPLVKFPLKDLAAEETERVTGTTLAELGNRNRPLDMISYSKDGQDYLLMTNSARGTMKISTNDIARDSGITERVDGLAGQEYETVDELAGVVQLDKLNDTHAVVVMQQGENGDMTLKTVELP